jgi:predicted chitinase
MAAYIDYTEAELRRFSPNMKPFYRDVLLSPFGKACLRKAGVLSTARRWTHFMGQFGGETGGGVVVRESLTYTTVAAIRKAWPTRASKHSDAWIKANLLRNPVALRDWAYGGRMGNAKGTPGKPHPDGYSYRGGGWLQTTGKSAVADYCAKCGLTLRSDILDDPEATLQFACWEWQESGCNELADANDLLGISKAINTRSASSRIYPNGMEHRQAWFDKARAIWWDAEAVDERQTTTQPEETSEDLSPPQDAGIAVVEVGADDGPEVSDKPARPAGDTSWFSERSFSHLNRLAEEGSRLAQHIRALKSWVWGILTTLWAAATMVDPGKGTGSVVGQWIAAHPFLAVAIIGTAIGLVI